MALHQSKVHHTKWMHMENGKAMVRRLHRMEIQAKNGRVYTLRGENLPEAMITNVGDSHKGEHVAQILLNPRPTPSLTSEEINFYPKARDVLHIGLGIFCFLLVRFVLVLLEF